MADNAEDPQAAEPSSEPNEAEAQEPSSEPESPASSELDAAPESPQTAGRGAARILIAEDVLPVRRMLQKILSSAGYDVDVAENGEVALSMLRMANPPFDLVVLDLVMPVLDGVRTLAQMRKEGLYDPPKVLICSSRGDRGTVQLAGKLGVCGYIRKPFKTDTVLDKVRNALESSKQSEAQASAASSDKDAAGQPEESEQAPEPSPDAPAEGDEPAKPAEGESENPEPQG